MKPREIAVLVFDNISPFHLSVPCLVFEDRNLEGFPSYCLKICASEPVNNGALRTSTGFRVQTDLSLEDVVHADVLIVPSWRNVKETPPEPMLNALREAYRRGATIVGLCLGAFVLAEAGLLEGQEATTHWSALEEFSKRYPQIQLVPDVLYLDVDGGRIVTSAGTVAGLDCCLHLVRSWHGAEVANRIAKRIVIAPHRLGGQAQYIEQPMHDASGGDRLSNLMNWVVANLSESHSLDSLSQRVSMSRRNFTRRFRELTGTTVGQWLLGQRLLYAQRMLETTQLSVDTVAQLSGFGTASSLRLYFQREYNTSPSTYRALFTQA